MKNIKTINKNFGKCIDEFPFGNKYITEMTLEHALYEYLPKSAYQTVLNWKHSFTSKDNPFKSYEEVYSFVSNELKERCRKCNGSKFVKVLLVNFGGCPTEFIKWFSKVSENFYEDDGSGILMFLRDDVIDPTPMGG